MRRRAPDLGTTATSASASWSSGPPPGSTARARQSKTGIGAFRTCHGPVTTTDNRQLSSAAEQLPHNSQNGQQPGSLPAGERQGDVQLVLLGWRQSANPLEQRLLPDSRAPGAKDLPGHG